MERLHAHVSVMDMAESIHFYSALFGSQPTVLKEDYAKWTLDEPRVNFVISQRGERVGLSHLGTHVESAKELLKMHIRLENAALPFKEEIHQACCYATSDKYWTIDPQGIAWALFNSLESIATFNKSVRKAEKASRCGTEPATVSGSYV